MLEISFLPSGAAPVTAVMVTTPLISVPGLVMKHLVPLITHSPSLSSALVLVLPASEPASGSVRPKAANISPRARGTSHSRF